MLCRVQFRETGMDRFETALAHVFHWEGDFPITRLIPAVPRISASPKARSRPGAARR